MGGCFSCLNKEYMEENNFYGSLRVPKPDIVDLKPIKHGNNSDSDIPLFAPAIDTDDYTGDLITDPETLTDDELNRYTSKLSNSD